ncbi:MAG: methyl-accepting chemotaxis protein [bacterium]|nr:methyl-accepting chemotaxis protein [bacterium]
MPDSDVGRDSIQRRIQRGFFVTTGLALVLTAGALFTTASLQFRQDMDENLRVLARVTGANSEASLLFDDDQAAMETLRALKAVESIEAAVVYDGDGRVFAKYVRADIEGFRPPRDLSYEPTWTREHIDLAAKIRMGEEQIGTVYLRSDTKQVQAFLFTSLAIVFGVVVISLVLCWWGAARLQQTIATPLEQLVQGAASMAAGDLSTQVTVSSDDETGALARAFNAMVDSLRGLVSQVGENTRYVATAMGKLTSASTTMREEAQRQEEAVESTAESIGSIIASMHTVNANVEALSETAIETSSAAIEMDSSIAETANHIDELSEIIETTASSVVEMTSGIREIARSADILNQSTESTAQALELLSGSVRTVESNANESHALSDQTQSKAEQGMSAVHQTVEGMVEIQESFEGIESIISSLSEKSESIGAVVKVIESVVEQTNLLALNAAIISSQAGEHGRAFSVVAEEVRSLAERTASSTREIADLIDSVQGGVHSAVAAMAQGSTRVERGVELSNTAGRILREIGESTQQSNRWAKEIVEATRSQAADIDQVGVAMTQVKETATQLNRGTHEQDSATAEITRGVEQMRHLGLEVKNSAQEQRRESSLITQSVEIVASKIKEISVETKDQSKRADQIQEALAVFREVTVQTTRRAAETAETVKDLADHAEGLEQEIDRFRL